ncbi:MAG: serine--tRNA ligase [Bacteroidetes bacterium]|nr:serine--tRNA ligase [Bacteroidota bacterium]
MLEINTLRQSKEIVIKGLAKRNLHAEKILDEILKKDSEWRGAKTEMEVISAKLNQLSKIIGEYFQQGKQKEADELKNETGELKMRESELKLHVEELDIQISNLMYSLPNIPNELVKQGKSAEDNEIIFEKGEAPLYNFDPLPHWDLVKKYNLIDFELGVKVTGAGFPFYIGKGAKLQRALIQFFLDEAEKEGYTEYIAPFMVNEASATGTGQLPDKEGQMYHSPTDDFYLIPTAEVPLTNIYRDVVFPSEDFSIKLTGYTPCFRREAGSYGKDVRGLNRLHQFDKVEIVRIEHPSNTARALDEMVEYVKKLLEKLGLQFRILRLCGGDMGFASALTYDFEVYSAAQQKWLEVSSVSRFDTFQSNRLKLRFKTADKKTQLCHTLNGSALALPRILASILENFQDQNGIQIPEVLHKYLTFSRID